MVSTVCLLFFVQQRTSLKLQLNKKLCVKHPERVVVSEDDESVLTPMLLSIVTSPGFVEVNCNPE